MAARQGEYVTAFTYGGDPVAHGTFPPDDIMASPIKERLGKDPFAWCQPVGMTREHLRQMTEAREKKRRFVEGMFRAMQQGYSKAELQGQAARETDMLERWGRALGVPRGCVVTALTAPDGFWMIRRRPETDEEYRASLRRNTARY